MSINFTNLSAVLQAKINAVTQGDDEKKLLLIAKAVESAVGNIAVSDVANKGDEEVARVAAKGTEQVGVVSAAGTAQVAAVAAEGVSRLQSLEAFWASVTQGAPEALNTLDELAAALGDDANFAAGVTNALSGKLDKTGGTISAALLIQGALSLGATLTLGGELDGAANVYKNLHSKVIDLGSVSGAVTINVSQGGDFVLKPTGATTVSFTGFPVSGRAAYWSVEVDGPASNTVSFTGVTWDSGTAPTIQTGTKQTILSFRTRNAGAKVVGAASFGDVA
jgi:hypothetical protein